MKASTYTSHRRRIGRTVRHIDLRLDDDIDVRMLADMACFSPFHFLRVFQDLTEETPLSMVRRLRLERSRKRLLAGGSIREAADEARFESTQAFCRAFRSIFGVTPSKIANGEIRIKATNIPPAIVSIPSRRSISVDFRGAGEALSGEFGHLLGLARPLIQRFPVAVAKASQDDPFAEQGSQCNCRMLVMMPEEGLRETKLPVAAVDGGLHAVWRQRGSLLDARADYRRLVADLLPAWGYRKSDAPIIRVYHNDPALVPRDQQRWSMFIPVVPSGTS